MQKGIKTQLIIIISSMIIFSAAALGEELKVGFIKSVTGSVSVKRGETVISVNPGDPLFKSDVLTTQTNSSVGIIFTDGTTFAVDQSAEINIKDYLFQPKSNAYAFELFLKKGKAIYSSGRIEKLAPDKVCLSTPKATVGVRGTHFIIQVD
ncbi:FecR domain-containing protein [uncultured Desulfobacter sp.]|uniref:FecR family protein n=1 Tax=uncultured Desulfobacter sp. TaxID=240139 RepID=UPI002AAB8C06|nr:FecR domain-containing protein [uncultured Desulfobacter sp.]